MRPDDIHWSVFTKPWRDAPTAELGRLVRTMGFDSIELPVRPGYQVTPADARSTLASSVRELETWGIGVASVAAGTDEDIFAACADAGVPVIRIMVPISPNGYSATDTEIRLQLDELSRRAERYGVRVGIQPHYDDYISDSTGLHQLLRDYDPRHIGAVWDAAHDALARKRPEHGLELLWPWLMIANLKSAYFARVDDLPDHDDPVWEPVFTDARTGMAEWSRALTYLAEHDFSGPICLTAEYTDETGLVEKVTKDLTYAKELWNRAVSRMEPVR
jgi:sugar phosphate isomerase/epimerase